jgi:rubredoxin
MNVEIVAIECPECGYVGGIEFVLESWPLFVCPHCDWEWEDYKGLTPPEHELKRLLGII